ncbi:HEAT repeat domain-containing protein [Streptomyces tritici]|uniref:HEAT repeat domain-containing protein n=1 Tax=Streptomyces tritici TaxID=2054410 RepID=UPI003AEF76D2
MITPPDPLPADVPPGSPEQALAVADGAAETLPEWRKWPAEVLVPAVRVALLRAELERGPEALEREERGEPLYQAVRATDICAVRRPAALVEGLAAGGDPVLEAEALRLAREGLRANVLGPRFVRDVLTGLLGSPAEAVVAGALTELGEPWAAVEPLPAGRLTALLDGPALTAEAALAAAEAHGHGELLRRTAEDRDRPGRVRQRALARYGETARRDDVAAVLALAAEDPLLLGGAAVDCLRAMHRRGHFPTDADVPAVLGLALADHAIPARDAATILYTSRHALLRLLLDAAPDDPGWERRLDLLVALDGQGATGLPVAAELAALLPGVPAPGPFLRALRALRDPGTEPAVLAVLPKAPADALDALEAVGGELTVRALTERLGLDGDEPVDVTPELRAVQDRALELLWLLNTDPGLRHRVLVRLDPDRLPARIAADLGGPDERELAVLASHVDPLRPVDAFRRLADHGGPGTLPVLADLLLRIAGDPAAVPEPDDPDRREHAVPRDVVDALCGLGRRLHARGRIRPPALLDAADAEAAGQAVAAELVLGLVERDGVTAPEQAVLLAVLLHLPRAPHRTVRARVHRLLRHPDRHVRKHVVALLARDSSGDGVAALSAGLLALTGPAQDPQTVRQTVTALGEAGARWAAGGIAACLDHPNMNVRKTAARALATAGTPAIVPRLLHGLGRTDNPGLRELLVAALRALLGDTCAATVSAAARRESDERVRTRLLSALSCGPAPDAGAAYLRRLTERGWDPDLALALADLPGGHPVGLAELRPYLSDWLELAGRSAGARSAVLRLLPKICPAPWPPHERAAFARSLTVLLDGLAEAEGELRDRLIELLEAVAPELPRAAAGRLAVALRALPPLPPGRRSTLPLLQLCGAVVVRADLDRELTAAALSAEPEAVRTRLLRETFGVTDTSPDTTSDASAHASWRGELAAAVRTVDGLAAFRDRSDVRDSRALLAALIDVQTDAAPAVRAAALDWMTDLQPLGLPAWTLAETAHEAPAAPRDVSPADLDQPRSAAQHERLRALLGSDLPEQRNTAARVLLAWPEPAARAAVLDAYLRGRVDEPDSVHLPALRRALAEADPAALLARAEGAEQFARLAQDLGARELTPLLPVLLHLWERGPVTARSDAAAALRRLPADLLVPHVEDRIARGATGLLDLLAGRPLLRTAALTRLHERHPDAGLVLVGGPLRGPDAAERDADALRALRERAPATTLRPLDRAELVLMLRSGEPDRIRRALAQVTERRTGIEQPELVGLLRELLTHPNTGIRLLAHRTSRTLLDREAHLAFTEVLLDDPQPDVVRGAVRVLSRAGRQTVVPALTALLDHAHPTVRRAAEEGLVHLGPAAVPALRRAESRSRPDRRDRYTRLLSRIADQER